MGGVPGLPVSSAAEEQLLGNLEPHHPYFPFRGLVAVHEFAHGIQNLCFTQADHEQWTWFYEEAARAELYPGSHMMADVNEYFAVMTTWYFEVTDELGEISDRSELSRRFPGVFRALDEIYAGATVPEKYRTWMDRQPSLPPPPSHLGLDPFYKKHLNAKGLPSVGSSQVPDAALVRARDIINEMLASRPDLRATIAEIGVRVAIMAESEVTTDIPEHSDLNEAFPDVDWDTRARGLGATLARPVISGAEENILCYGDDVYRNEDIFAHEFAHTILQMGVEQQRGGLDFRNRLEAAYREALDAGLWEETYASENPDQGNRILLSKDLE